MEQPERKQYRFWSKRKLWSRAVLGLALLSAFFLAGRLAGVAIFKEVYVRRLIADSSQQIAAVAKITGDTSIDEPERQKRVAAYEEKRKQLAVDRARTMRWLSMAGEAFAVAGMALALGLLGAGVLGLHRNGMNRRYCAIAGAAGVVLFWRNGGPLWLAALALAYVLFEVYRTRKRELRHHT